MVKSGDLKDISADKDEGSKSLPSKTVDASLMGKVSGVIGKILDCCRE
jgi:hypothetical protein